MRVRHWAGGVPLLGPPATAAASTASNSNDTANLRPNSSPQPHNLRPNSSLGLNHQGRHHHFRFRPLAIRQPFPLLRQPARTTTTLLLYSVPNNHSGSASTCPGPASRQGLHTTPDKSAWHADTRHDGAQQYSSPETPHGSRAERPPPTSHQRALDALLAALRQDDALKLYLSLLDLTRDADPADPAFRKLIVGIPKTTFSDILRVFDPSYIQEHVDSAPGLRISYGAAIHTPLGELVNKWGIKVLYTSIHNRLRMLQQLRRYADIRPLLSDYSILLRCAAAAADHYGVKTIWLAARRDGHVDWLSATLYAEFVKARFLTESLYANNDLARYRLRPIDLYRSSFRLTRATIRSLKHLIANMRHRQMHRFGQNPRQLYFAIPLTRNLRHRTPLRRLERSAFRRGFLPSERGLACALLKANGRNGRIIDCYDILQVCWDIKIDVNWDTREIQVSGGANFRPDSPQAPNEELLEAIVHCFGSQAQVVIATQLLSYVSERYNIPVPNKVWSDLLDYIRIAVSKPASTEWRLAGIPSKMLRPTAAIDFWELSTNAPHSFQPGVRDYHNLSKCLIWDKSPMGRPLEIMKHIRLLYNGTAGELRTAWRELLQTTAQQVPNHAAYRRYRVLQSEKHYMWYCFHYTALQMLKKVKPMTVNDEDAVRNIPNIILEFSAFMPQVIRYRIATGNIELRSDHADSRWITTVQKVDDPAPHYGDGDEEEQLLWPDAEWDSRTAGLGDREDLSFETDPANESQEMSLPRRDEDQREDEFYTTVLKQTGDFSREHESTIEADEQEAQEENDDELVVDPADGLGTYESFDQFAEEALASFGLEDEPQENPAARQMVQEKHTSKHRTTSPPTIAAIAAATAAAVREQKKQASLHDNVAAAVSPTAPPRIVNQVQLVDRPAYMYRPLGSTSAEVPPGTRLGYEWPVFTGYHDDPDLKHFAAHRVLHVTTRSVGVVTELDPRKVSNDVLVGHCLWLR